MEEKLNIPNAIKLEENIYLVKKFLDQESLNSLVRTAENAEKWDANLDLVNPFWRNKTIDVGNEKITKCINEKQSAFLNNTCWINGNDKILRQFVGGETLNIHCDNPAIDDPSYKDDGTRWGMVIYLNEFNGGEIFYPKLNITYKPEPGDLVIHPASSKYEHGTKPVLEGSNRYIITGFGVLLSHPWDMP